MVGAADFGGSRMDLLHLGSFVALLGCLLFWNMGDDFPVLRNAGRIAAIWVGAYWVRCVRDMRRVDRAFLALENAPTSESAAEEFSQAVMRVRLNQPKHSRRGVILLFLFLFLYFITADFTEPIAPIEPWEASYSYEQRKQRILAETPWPFRSIRRWRSADVNSSTDDQQ
jgi:hypothetical protein